MSFGGRRKTVIGAGVGALNGANWAGLGISGLIPVAVPVLLGLHQRAIVRWVQDFQRYMIDDPRNRDILDRLFSSLHMKYMAFCAQCSIIAKILTPP